MTIEQLKERIQKTQEKIAKIEKRIKKWQDAQCEKYFLKEYDWLLNAGRDREYLWNEYIKNCNWELDRAIQDLHDAQLTLEKYQNLLALEVAKDNEFENHKIIVIWNFLLNYKEQVAEFIRNNMSVLNEYYEVNHQLCDWHNNNAYKVRRGELSKEEYNKVYHELETKEKELQRAIHPYTHEVATRKDVRQYVVNEEKLEEVLLKDCKARYFELVNEVTKYTGIIVDATNLSIHGGELNGIVIGTKGKAKVQTFSAGGWNIQCFHYRTLVKEVK